MIVLTVLSMLALGQEPPVVMSGPRRVAEPWVQSVRAVCDGNVLEVTGYGAGRPETRKAEVRVNGQPLRGTDAARLVTDISSFSAVYRFQLMCQLDGGFSVTINRGEAQIDETVRYEVAGADIRGGTLVSYSGMETSDASGFWFR